QAAKLANYAKYQRLCDFLFVAFGAAFIGTRLIIYPLWILKSTMFESWEIIGPYASWWVFNPLLLVLQVLHIIWSYLIVRIAFKALMRGKLEHPRTVPAVGAVGVKVEGHQAFWTCDYRPFISVLTTVPPHTDLLGVSTKTKAGLVTEDDPLPF
ncbi:hypothetical protein NFI96_003795, partial [Prochilodus magdalenae]